jgi:hypothetical protein
MLGATKKNGLVTDMTHSSPMMKEIIQGVEYASVVYNLNGLCSKLPPTAIVKVLSVNEGDFAEDPNLLFYIIINEILIQSWLLLEVRRELRIG